jgi:hypothetical protein
MSGAAFLCSMRRARKRSLIGQSIVALKRLGVRYPACGVQPTKSPEPPGSMCVTRRAFWRGGGRGCCLDISLAILLPVTSFQ